MNEDEVWRVIDAQRLSLTALMERVSTEEWDQPSLCAGWTVRDVAAHVALQNMGFGRALTEMVRARGDLNRMIHDSACRYAARPVERLIEEIRAMVGSRHHHPGVTYLETLTDILVHGQDIMVPLGRALEIPPAAAATTADRVLTAPPRLRPWTMPPGCRFVATDIEWAAGEGHEVRGSMRALLLLLTGRRGAALPHLSGAGVPVLTAG